MRVMRRAMSRLWVAMIAVTPDSWTSVISWSKTTSAVSVVEIAGRLIGQQDFRGVGNCARDGDPLLLTAGKLRRSMVKPLGEAQVLQDLARVGFRIFLRGAEDELGQHHVFERTEFRQQVMKLVDEAELGATKQCSLSIRYQDAILAVQKDFAVVRPVQQSEDVEQR